MTESKKNSNDMLNNLFDNARKSVPEPSRKLYESILTESKNHLPKSTIVSRRKKTDFWNFDLIMDFGAIPSAISFTGAALIGVWIGAYSPTTELSPLNLFMVNPATELELPDPFQGLELTDLEIY